MSRRKKAVLAQQPDKIKPMWRVHTPNMLDEILINPNLWIMRQPLRIFGNILAELAEHAAELNDPKLNLLMARLTLYAQADPASPDYDRNIIDKLVAAIKESDQDERPMPNKRSRAPRKAAAPSVNG